MLSLLQLDLVKRFLRLTRTVRELIITSGSAGGLDEDEAYGQDAITNLLAERKVRISQMASKGVYKGFNPRSTTRW